MASPAFHRWQADGEPYRDAVPLADLTHTIAAHGYTTYTRGDDSHMEAEPPEDHTPFSETGWPVPSAYGVGHALDIMPPPKTSKLPTLTQLAQQIIRDKNANFPGTQCIKYVNWTDTNGNMWQDSWTPDHAHNPSDDIGHLHWSVRSDMDTTHTDYDPVARVRGDNMPLTDADAVLVAKAVHNQILGQSHTTIGSAIQTTNNQVAAIAANVAALAGKDFVDEPAIVAGVLTGLGALDPTEAATALKAVLSPEQVVALAAALTA